jgi:dolichol-phosphate mannosyltransferase
MSLEQRSKRDGQPVAMSIVVPVFNEEEVFPLLHRRIEEVATQLPSPLEVLYINDGSDDRTPELMKEVASKDARFVAVHLSRNFGHQAAVSAGMRLSQGDVVVLMDGDLQDPPELIPSLYEELKKGFDVVYAIRENRTESIWLRSAYALFYRILRMSSKLEIPIDSGDFGILSRRATDKVNAMPEHHRFLRGLRCYVGFPQSGIRYTRESRYAGQSKYTLSRLIKLAADGIFTFSEMPLRFASFVGILTAILSVCYTIYLVVWRLFSDVDTRRVLGKGPQ